MSSPATSPRISSSRRPTARWRVVTPSGEPLAGVRVQVITPRPPGDNFFVYHAALYFIEELLAAGVRVYEYQPGMMHAKAVVVDGQWAMLGTANLDNRSMFLNFEQMGVFDGATEVEAIQTALEGILAQSRLLTPEGLRTRPLIKRFVSSSARLLAPLL